MRVVAELREVHKTGDLARSDELGKQAMGIWAQGQLAATLALAEQQRIANLIALGLGTSSKDIREGLGLA